MNKSIYIKTFIFSFILLLNTSFSYASEPYFGVKAGLVIVDEDGLTDATNLGLNIGFPISTNMAFEGELTTTILEGDVDLGFTTLNWDVTTLAGYFTYRTSSSPYFKLKAGILYEDVSIGSFSESDTGLSFGAGVGWNLSKTSKLELEMTIIEADLTFFSIGFLF